MLENTFVGLDVHRKIVVATALDEGGRQLTQAKFGPTPSELTAFLESLPGTKHVALEACPMWPTYYDVAASTGASVTLSNPVKTRLIAEASLKSDRVDSEALARLLRLDSLPTAFAPPPETRQLRSLVTDRTFYRRYWAAVANHTYSFLIRHGVRYEDHLLRHRRKREILRQLHIPEVDRGLDTLAQLEARTKDLDRVVHAAWVESEEAQLLTTVPGIGELTAIALVAFLCPIDRFHTSGQVCSYVGLVPRSYQSADRQWHGKIKRDSNALLRWLLVEASWRHRQRLRGGDVARTAGRVARRRGAGKGSVAGAHKLLRIVYAILKERRAFLPHAPGTTAPVRSLRCPRTAAIECVGRASLGPSATDCLSAR
ncbi:MAG: IS110 family transposase [Thermoplasmata archaeon]